ncbi:MAG: PKD domain-containing protein [Bacteroidetes bacterium]|nr:MAG: PKD domain-containing protein [Bacteroidota bacterium]
MKLKTFYTLGLMLLSFWVMAQNVTVSGFVYAGEDAQPVPGYPVMVLTADGNVWEAFTDESGEYLLEFQGEPSPIVDFLAIISVFDFCTGEEHQEFITVADGDVSVEVDFYICGDDDPDDPEVICDAFFYYEQIGVEPYEAAFFDLSYVFPPANAWFWDFGDGTSSTEQNPIHEWAEPGEYVVTLTISNDSCSASFTSVIWLDETIDCVCPDYWDPVCVVTALGDTITFSNICFAECEGYTDEDIFDCEWDDPCDCYLIWDPVCVITPDGEIIEFPNECFAECEGYGEDSFVDCDDDCNCYDLWAPVCVINDAGDIITYSNECYAMCDGYGADSFVDCDDCECDDVWDPVCVAAGGAILTFPNECYAECEGYGPDSFIDCDDDCECPDEWDPVCVATPSGGFLTFPNACFAECEGFGPDVYFPCDGCECPEFYDPVCVLTEDGIIIEFDNFCFAQCEGYGPDSFVDCEDDCNCPDVWEPVCVATGAGIITFPNACFANCAGFGDDSFVDCDDDCVCPDVWNPVCVATPDGGIITFPNPCYAECEGFTADQYFVCDGCECPDYYDPVCVITETGEIIEFVNFCFAQCEGYGPDSYIDCDDNCDCPDEWDPVCVITDWGGVLTFPNACFAECEGFDPQYFVDCDWEQDCYADFYVESDNPIGVIGLEVVFTDASYTSEGEIVAWAWDFGDGNTSNEQNPEHTYEEEGIYEVVLEIETSEGCTSVYVLHLCVADDGYYEGPDCQALFYFELANDAGTSFAFFDASIGENDYWIWDFGDGNSSDEQNPVHTYENPGIYLVTLTVGNEDCSSSVTMLVFSDPDVWYESECVALFVPFIGGDPATGVGENTVFFLNMSSPDAVEFNWDFGDGTTSDEFITIHEYEGPGIYDVTLTITTADGCTNAFTATVTIGEGDDEDGFTGTPQYSLTTDVDEVEAISETTVFPNPVTRTANFKFNLAEAGNYNIELISLDGSLLTSQRGAGIKGINTATIDVAQLADGLYFARIQSGTATTTIKVVKD